MQTRHLLSLNPQGLHRVAYQEWGERDNPRVIVCVHGLARNSRDFDDLARALAKDYRVICPDIVGRGQSDWLPPGSPYGIPQYVQDMIALIARLDVERVDWIGTSMGGIIGTVIASYSDTPIQRLVLNDIGAFIPRQALQRIGGYVGLDQRFDSVAAVEAMLREQYIAFRGLEDRQWSHLAHHGSRATDDGQLALHYDPAIGDYTRAAADQDVDLWPFWQQIDCPQLLLWAEQSDVLTRATVERMRDANSQLEVVSYPDIPHAPSLMQPEQIEAVVDWLAHNRPA